MSSAEVIASGPVGSDGRGDEPPLRLLLVDDDEVDRLIVQRRLREAGMKAMIREASSTADALGMLGGPEEFDCVILDYNLPGGDGRSVLFAARAGRPPVPVVMLTGQGDEEVAVELMKAGAADYVPKSSLSAARLATALRYAVDLSRAQIATARAEEEVLAAAMRSKFLAEASGVLASSLELNTTLVQIADLSVPVLGDYCVVYLVDEQESIIGVAAAHRDPDRAEALGLLAERYRPSMTDPKSLVGDVIRTGRTALVRDYTHDLIAPLTADPVVYESLQVLDPRSVLNVPLQARGSVLGSISFNRGAESGPYTSEEIALAEDLAGRTAVAVENVRLYEAAERARTRTERLQQVTALLAAALPQDEVAHLFVSQVREAFNADTAWVGMVDRDGTALESIAQAGFDDQIDANGFPPIPLDANIPSTFVMRECRGQWFPSREALERAYPEVISLTSGLDQEAIVIEPLDVGGGPFGVVTLGFRRIRDFQPEDRELGLAMTRQFAQAMERARLFEAEQRLRATAERLAQQMAAAALSITRRADVGGALEEIAVQARELIGAHLAVTILAGGSGETLSSSSVSDKYQEWQERTELLDPDTLAKLQPGKGWPVRLRQDELERHPAFKESAREGESAPMRGLLAVPLLGLKGESMGMVQLSDRYDGDFTAEDESVLIQLAHTGAAALENAQLYASAQASRADAEEANRAKSEFLARMSHDLRTPLNAIGGYSELLEIGVHGPVNEAQLGAIERIKRAQQHLLTLINDILSFARLEAGQVVVQEAEVPIRPILLELAELLHGEAESRGIHLDIQPARDVGRVWGDAERLMQVLINLTSNALKFTPSGGRVAVTCAAEGEWMRLCVIDTGVGIPPDRLEAVFNPFVQGRDSTEERREGVGLGLAISRELTRMMRGDLTVTSEEGKGSTFTIRLRRSP